MFLQNKENLRKKNEEDYTPQQLKQQQQQKKITTDLFLISLNENEKK
jgi:hypothetical protein